jgi:hypothetical protein
MILGGLAPPKPHIQGSALLRPDVCVWGGATPQGLGTSAIVAVPPHFVGGFLVGGDLGFRGRGWGPFDLKTIRKMHELISSLLTGIAAGARCKRAACNVSKAAVAVVATLARAPATASSEPRRSQESLSTAEEP